LKDRKIQREIRVIFVKKFDGIDLAMSLKYVDFELFPRVQPLVFLSDTHGCARARVGTTQRSIWSDLPIQSSFSGGFVVG